MIDEPRLLGALGSSGFDHSSASELLADFTRLPPATTEMLQCLAGGPKSTTAAARELGIRARTLQRHFARYVCQPPNYWLRLGRIRNAGRQIAAGVSLAEIAANCGYSDQSHLTRECRHWFGATPAVLRVRRDLTDQLLRNAYA